MPQCFSINQVTGTKVGKHVAMNTAMSKLKQLAAAIQTTAAKALIKDGDNGCAEIRLNNKAGKLALINYAYNNLKVAVDLLRKDSQQPVFLAHLRARDHGLPLQAKPSSGSGTSNANTPWLFLVLLSPPPPPSPTVRFTWIWPIKGHPYKQGTYGWLLLFVWVSF